MAGAGDGTVVIEVVTFRLGASADEAQFLEADAEVQTLAVPYCEGFVRRTTARSDDGGWAVVSLWSDRGAAEAAASAVAAHPASIRMAGLVDEATVDRRLYTSLD